MVHTAAGNKLLNLIICMAIALTALIVPSATAHAEGLTGTVNISTGYLKIRETAPSGKEIGKLYKGDIVNILDSTSVSGWYKIEYKGTVGYSSADYIIINQPEKPDVEYTPDADFEEYMNTQGFPESYKPYLRQLHANHPNWIFKGVETNLEWNDVIEAEMRLGRSLIQKLNSHPESYYSYQQGAYNAETGKHVVFDGSNWIQASEALIEYAVDPRNYLNETYIFSMLGLNHSASETVDGVNGILKGSFMAGAYPDFNEFATYADAFLAASKASDVSSYHLASSCFQEQGTGGTQLSHGTVPGYTGYYNFFNVGAYPSGGNTNVVNGAIYAKNKGWDTPYKSILGGAEFMGSGYIKIGQNTKYLHKFDLVPYGGLYSHQYMTNILAAFSESSILKKAYTGDLLESNHAFNIPIFKNMPDSACVKPTGAGDNNYLLSSLSVDGHNLTPSFDTYTNSYEVIVDYEVTSVNISATAMSEQAQISGVGSHELIVGDNSIEIVVTAKTGTENTYKIIVSRQAEAVAPPPDAPIDPSINGSYTIGDYITGVEPETTVEAFIEALGVSDGSAKVFSPDGTEKSADALIGSGCKVTIYKNDGSEYLTYEAVVFGDINGDGKVMSVDLFMGQRYIFGTYNLSGARLKAADINHDGNIRTVDLFMGQRHIFGTYQIDQKG